MNTDLQKGGDLLELAWGIIANAGGGDWERESKEWQDAASKWRDCYHGSLTSKPEGAAQWMMCPNCKAERTDYEGEPDKYLARCPSCGSEASPVSGAAQTKSIAEIVEKAASEILSMQVDEPVRDLPRERVTAVITRACDLAYRKGYYAKATAGRQNAIAEIVEKAFTELQYGPLKHAPCIKVEWSGIKPIITRACEEANSALLSLYNTGLAHRVELETTIESLRRQLDEARKK